MKYILAIICFVLICGCNDKLKYEGVYDSDSLVYGGWRSRSTNIRLKMIMNQLGIKEDDFVIHKLESFRGNYNDVVHKKTETCKYCNQKHD